MIIDMCLCLLSVAASALCYWLSIFTSDVQLCGYYAIMDVLVSLFVSFNITKTH